VSVVTEENHIKLRIFGVVAGIQNVNIINITDNLYSPNQRARPLCSGPKVHSDISVQLRPVSLRSMPVSAEKKPCYNGEHFMPLIVQLQIPLFSTVPTNHTCKNKQDSNTEWRPGIAQSL